MDKQCIIFTEKGTRFSRYPQEKCEVCGKLCTNLYMTKGKEICKNCRLELLNKDKSTWPDKFKKGYRKINDDVWVKLHPRFVK